MKTYHGGCHCGALRFAVALDLGAGTMKCNCSYCAKARLWGARTTPDRFSLDATPGALSDYVGAGNAVAHHFFCARCGVHTHDRVDMPNGAGHAYINVSLACLDDATPDELIAAPLRYLDGRRNAWRETPAETRHL